MNPQDRPSRANDPILELARLTKAGKIVPLPDPGTPSLRAQWRHMLRGGIDRICLRQLRLRRAKAGEGTAPAEDPPSGGLRLLRRTLAASRPRELAFVLPEDSVRAVWEVADGDDGLLWCAAIPRGLERECGAFTDEERDAWCNPGGTVGDLAALLDRILACRRPLPPPRPRAFCQCLAKNGRILPNIGKKALRDHCKRLATGRMKRAGCT